MWQSRAFKASIFSWWYCSTVLSSFPPEKLCFSTCLNHFCSSQDPPTAPKHHFCNSTELQLEGNHGFPQKNACFSCYFIGFFEFSTGKSVIFSTFLRVTRRKSTFFLKKRMFFTIFHKFFRTFHREISDFQQFFLRFSIEHGSNLPTPPSVSCKDVQRLHETTLGKRRVAMELLAGRSFLDAHFVRSLLPDPLDRALVSKRRWEAAAWGARAAIRCTVWMVCS